MEETHGQKTKKERVVMMEDSSARLDLEKQFSLFKF